MVHTILKLTKSFIAHQECALCMKDMMKKVMMRKVKCSMAILEESEFLSEVYWLLCNTLDLQSIYVQVHVTSFEHWFETEIPCPGSGFRYPL